MDLYSIVEEYADLGEHRTGSPVATATTEWLAAHLADLGLTVRTEPFEYEQWVAESQLLADGEPVDHLPVPYEFTGEVETSRPEVVNIDPIFGGIPAVLDSPIAAARDRGSEALVVATDHPEGSLVAINRIPHLASGFPTVLVAGRDYERISEAAVEFRLDGRLVRSESSTLLAATPKPGAKLMVTTPLTGWFRCAGERGTGIAVLLDLLSRTADLPIQVVATTGHELDYLGARRWLADTDLEPAAIAHLGASIAVDAAGDDGTRHLVETRHAWTNFDDHEATGIAAALNPAAVPLTTRTREFFGEASVFSEFSVPLLSITGAGIDFHTPWDLPARVTSPESLRIAADAVHAATIELDRLARADL